jgi:hypothetical protein
MKKNTVILIALSAVLSFAGCSDFLEPNPKGLHTELNYFKSEQDAVNAVQGIYAYVLHERFAGNHDVKYEACSDDIFNSGDHYATDPQVNNFTVTPGNALLANEQWQTKYEVISRANLVIMNVPDMSRDQITEAIQNRCVGEAYFYRAFAHWWLYLVHGEIPVITDEDVRNNNYNKPKNTIDEVLAQIEADLLKAADLLPATHPASESGRVHKGSAWAYLAQLYMHWSCYPGKDACLDKAIEAGNRIIGNNDYRMMDDYSACFTLKGGATNSEMLLQLNGSNGVDYKNNLEKGYFWQIGGEDWNGWSSWMPTKSLADAFGTDPRKAKTILVDGDVVTVDGVSKTFSDTLSPTGYAFVKNAQYKLQSDGQGFTNDLKQNFAMMRTSDVYLLVAEAKIRKGLSGDVEINAVRARVGLPALSGATKDDLILERRLELAGENRRFFDLRRWDRIGWVDIVSILANPDAYNGTARTFVRPRHYFFPIPQEQIDKTNGVLTQNPEYN